MSAVTEASFIFSSLAEFFSNQSQYLLGTSTTKPDETTLKDMGHADLLSLATEGTVGPAGFNIGGAQEAIYFSVAVDRELSSAELTKSEIFDNCASEAEGEKVFYSIFELYTASIIQGGVSNGSKS